MCKRISAESSREELFVDLLYIEEILACLLQAMCRHLSINFTSRLSIAMTLNSECSNTACKSSRVVCNSSSFSPSICRTRRSAYQEHTNEGRPMQTQIERHKYTHKCTRKHTHTHNHAESHRSTQNHTVTQTDASERARTQTRTHAH